MRKLKITVGVILSIIAAIAIADEAGCFDSCSDAFDNCVSAGNTQSACALQLGKCQNSCRAQFP
jgi:hypothetical protein